MSPVRDSNLESRMRGGNAEKLSGGGQSASGTELMDSHWPIRLANRPPFRIPHPLLPVCLPYPAPELPHGEKKDRLKHRLATSKYSILLKVLSTYGDISTYRWQDLERSSAPSASPVQGRSGGRTPGPPPAHLPCLFSCHGHNRPNERWTSAQIAQLEVIESWSGQKQRRHNRSVIRSNNQPIDQGRMFVFATKLRGSWRDLYYGSMVQCHPVLRGASSILQRW